MSIKAKLDALAAKLATKLEHELTTNDTPLQDVTDAFKALTAYYAAGLKDKSGVDPDREEGTFAAFKRRIGSEQEQSHASTAPVPGGRRRN